MSRALTILLLWSQLAHADNASDARRRFESGNSLYSAGDFEAALHEFEAGYALVANPKFLLNMGQTYRKLGRLDEARASLLKYMATLAPGDPRRADIAHVVAEIDLDLRPRPVTTPARPSHRRERLAGIVLLAFAGASAISGAALVGVAVRDDDLLANPPANWRFDPSVGRERDATWPAGLTLLSLSALATVGGAVALHLSLRR